MNVFLNKSSVISTGCFSLFRIDGELKHDIALIRLCDMKRKNLVLPSIRLCGLEEKSSMNKYTIIVMGRMVPNIAKREATFPKLLQLAYQMEAKDEDTKCGSMEPFDESFVLLQINPPPPPPFVYHSWEKT